ncbi:hypothetical protein L4D00_20145 [Photobacterium swingsii]|uniref:Outer membrane protein beta-barrel domain-containing protein n=1 Tax=Photobacterium swingsii TaxID=680026 RepID=A0A0J8VD34_9GAMM|nr:hypothetical protein [Photobacterium swingsii]KMV30997.1 hypothetical protein AB733_08305 [Photobacterium swingsii]PSW23480.1 hypothetical protein C9I94_15255 [Photobacterium swingsii]
MKKLLVGLALIAAVPFSAHASKGIGVFLGSPMSGIQYKHDDLRLSLGVEKFGVAFDKTFNLGSLTDNRKLDSLYTFVGAQYVDHHNKKVGVRSGVGFELPINSFELYGELGPSLYVVEEVDLDLEAALGFRIRF